VNTSSSVVTSSAEKKKRKRHGKVERAKYHIREARSELNELKTLLERSAQLSSLNASFANDLATHLVRHKPLPRHPFVGSQIVPDSVVNSVDESLVDNSGNNSDNGYQEEYSNRGSPIVQTPGPASPTQESPFSPFDTRSASTEGLNFVGAHLGHRNLSPSPSIAFSQYSPTHQDIPPSTPPFIPSTPYQPGPPRQQPLSRRLFEESPTHQDIPPSPPFIPSTPYQPGSPRQQSLSRRFSPESNRSYQRHSYRGNNGRRPPFNAQRRRYDSYRPPRPPPTLTREE
jgi:hypothetical protein